MTGDSHPRMTRGEARLIGMEFYYTGKPCSRGHHELRKTVTAQCIQCSRELAKEYAARNPEKVKRLLASWRANNEDHTRKYKKKYYDENVDVILAKIKLPNVREKTNSRRRLARAANLDKARAMGRKEAKQQKEKRAANRRIFAAAHPDIVLKRQRASKKRRRVKLATDQRNRRALKLKAGGSHTTSDINEIFKAQNGRCAYCKKNLRKPKKWGKHVDHIKPLAKGGTNDRKNLQILCQRCNVIKYDKDPLDFSRELGMLL